MVKQKQSNKNRSLVHAFLFIGLFAAISYCYFSSLRSHRFQIDEWSFIRKSYYLDLYLNRNFSDPRWYSRDDPAQPKVGAYIYGIMLRLAGMRDIEKSLHETGFTRTTQEGKRWWDDLLYRRIKVPRSELVSRPACFFRRSTFTQTQSDFPQELLPHLKIIWMGRRTSLLFTLGAVILLFCFARVMKSFLLGFLSALLVALNPLMFSSGSLAMTDSMQQFFFNINLLLTWFFLKAVGKQNSKRALALSLFLGVNAALSLGVKVSGVLILPFQTLIFLSLFMLQKKRNKPRGILLRSGGLLIASFLTVFVALHPYLYRDTARHFLAIFTNRLEISERDQRLLPIWAVQTRQKAIEFILGRNLLPQGTYTNFPIGKVPIDGFLFLAGLWFVRKKAIYEFSRRKMLSSELILLLWAAVAIGGLILYLQNDWPRYYLPAEVAITLFQAYAIAELSRQAFEIISHKGVR